MALNQQQLLQGQTYYHLQNSHDMNEESYCSDDDCEMDSASESIDGPENMKISKKTSSNR